MDINYTPEVGRVVAALAVQSWPLAALAATADLAETAIGMQGNAQGVAIGSAYIVPTGALTANDSNFYTITISKRTAGGSATTIATATTQTTGGGGTGNWTAFKAVPLTVSAGAFLAAGDVVTIQLTHSGTGVAIPASQVELFTTVN